MSNGVSYFTVDGAEIQRLVSRIEDVVMHEESNHVSIACLVVALSAYKPDIEADELQEAIKSTSEYLAALLTPGEAIH